MGCRQGQPTTITYANCHGLEIEDSLNEYKQAAQGEDDDTYEPSDDDKADDIDLPLPYDTDSDDSSKSKSDAEMSDDSNDADSDDDYSEVSLT